MYTEKKQIWNTKHKKNQLRLKVVLNVHYERAYEVYRVRQKKVDP